MGNLPNWKQLLGLLPIFFLTGSCFKFLPGDGGGQTKFELPRKVEKADVLLPDGYRIEVVTTGLTFPSGIEFDDKGNIYIVEAGYSYGEKWDTPRLLRIDRSGEAHEVARGGPKRGPWNGVAFYKGFFYVSEGGFPGRILRIDAQGNAKILVDNLPSGGDHHTNGPVIGPDEKIYFGQGTVTNSGVVGKDNKKFGWLTRHPGLHDIPCQDIALAGRNFETPNVLTKNDDDKVQTGAFLPFGQPSKPGQVVQGQIPCSGAIMRVSLDGGTPELVAWGLRNPFGLAFAPDGTLLVSDNGYDDRGSRPVHGAGDLLFRIDTKVPPKWYGWPDYSGNLSLRDNGFQPPFGPDPGYVLAKHPGAPEKPLAVLGVHAAATGLDVAPGEAFGHPAQIFVALFGDMAPGAGKVLAPVGFKVVRVDPQNGIIEEFIANKGRQNGPASWVDSGGIERPVDVKFDRQGESLYVLDFGIMRMGDDEGTFPQKNTGVLWRVTHAGTARVAGGGIE